MRTCDMKKHNYKVSVEWTGNEGAGTLDYRSYNRNHRISVAGKYDGIDGSSDASFRGDASKYNPEELFLSSLSACHMLWYLHLCSVNGIVVVDYRDNATGMMEESLNGSGRFVEVTLNPVVRITDKGLISRAEALHVKAGEMCFIANSINFKVKYNYKTLFRD